MGACRPGACLGGHEERNRQRAVRVTALSGRASDIRCSLATQSRVVKLHASACGVVPKPSREQMGKWVWVDPTAPNTDPPKPPVTITVTGPGETTTATATVKVTETVRVTPTPEKTTVTATPSQSPFPSPTPRVITKTVYRTKKPVVQPGPAVTLDSSSTERPMEPWDWASSPSVGVPTASPVQSQPQIVVQIPPTQPVSNDGPGAITWAVLGLVAVVILFLLPALKRKLEGGK